MTHLSVLQMVNEIRQFHPTAGSNVLVNAVAVALAESGGDTTAISPSGDYGTWQINRATWFGKGIIDDSNWTNQAVQVRAMWAISAGGTNWGAWCTVYNYDAPRRCGHEYIPYPEPGSPAGDNLSIVANVVNQLHGTPPPGSNIPATPPSQQLTPGQSAQFAYIREYLGSTNGKQLLGINNVAAQLPRIF